MNKIQGKRLGVDGTLYSIEDIKNWYTGTNVEKTIRRRLASVTANSREEQKMLNKIKSHLHEILLATPDTLYKWSVLYAKYKKLFEGVNSKDDTFGKRIYNAFNYKYYRSNGTVFTQLAKRLNVKTCPYCNMSYTLYANTDTKELAKFEFDHFFPKAVYPMFSMSLFNLIPSCPACNSAKRDDAISLKFNPYVSSIHENFEFKAKRNIPLLYGARLPDEVEIELISKSKATQAEVDSYNNAFNISALYGRHGDIVDDIYKKAYVYKNYYEYGFHFEFLGPLAKQYITELWVGNSLKLESIEKMPMTKFTQDIWAQALQTSLILPQDTILPGI